MDSTYTNAENGDTVIREMDGIPVGRERESQGVDMGLRINESSLTPLSWNISGLENKYKNPEWLATIKAAQIVYIQETCITSSIHIEGLLQQLRQSSHHLMA